MWLILVVAILHLVMTILLANYLDLRRQPSVKRPAILTYPYISQPNTDTPSQQPDEPTPPGLQLVLFLMLSVAALTVGLNGISAFLTTVLPPSLLEDDALMGLTRQQGLTVGLIGLAATSLSFAVLLSERFRQMLANIRTGGLFEPNAYVHRTALILAILMLADTTTNVILAGGVEGLAEQLSESTIGPMETVGNLLLMVTLALLGVGLIVRRSWSQVMERLALRVPTFGDWAYGLGAAFGSLILMFAFLATISLFIPPEVLEAQGAASDEIARALGDSLPMAFLAAMSAAVGEEILFRGALQPVFGILPTTLFFALLHTQYALTPGSVAIVLVGLVFAWLKEKQSTTAAIIAHFAYNFVLLGLAYLVIQVEQAGLLPEMFIHLLPF